MKVLVQNILLGFVCAVFCFLFFSLGAMRWGGGAPWWFWIIIFFLGFYCISWARIRHE